ncbi:MAG: DUF3592 domain-containing protein [Aureispira sp.]|nr:DUF3592 domain-containing protein [Aureispira sp.]
MNAYKNVSYVGFVIFFFGVVVAIYGFSFLLTQQDLEANAVRVQGTVVDINKKAIYRSPYVKFTTLDGQDITFLADLEVNVDFFDYTVGQTVDVIYHKDNPNKAKIDTFWQNNFEQVFLGGFGLFLMLFGFIMRRIFLGKAKRYEQLG